MQRCGVELGALLLPGDSDPLSEPAPRSVAPFFPDLPRTVRFTPLQPKRKALSAAERTQYHFDKRCDQQTHSLISAAASCFD